MILFGFGTKSISLFLDMKSSTISTFRKDIEGIIDTESFVSYKKRVAFMKCKKSFITKSMAYRYTPITALVKIKNEKKLFETLLDDISAAIKIGFETTIFTSEEFKTLGFTPTQPKKDDADTTPSSQKESIHLESDDNIKFDMSKHDFSDFEKGLIVSLGDLGKATFVSYKNNIKDYNEIAHAYKLIDIADMTEENYKLGKRVAQEGKYIDKGGELSESQTYKIFKQNRAKIYKITEKLTLKEKDIADDVAEGWG